MADATKTIEDWERTRGIILVGNVDLKKSLTGDEFQELCDTQAWTGVNHTDRIKFLQDNGHDVNRANMTDPSLSARESN